MKCCKFKIILFYAKFVFKFQFKAKTTGMHFLLNVVCKRIHNSQFAIIRPHSNCKKKKKKKRLLLFCSLACGKAELLWG